MVVLETTYSFWEGLFSGAMLVLGRVVMKSLPSDKSSHSSINDYDQKVIQSGKKDLQILDIWKKTKNWALPKHWFTSLCQYGFLVGGWTNPFEKYARQIGSFPQVGVKIKDIWNHHPVFEVNDARALLVSRSWPFPSLEI